MRIRTASAAVVGLSAAATALSLTAACGSQKAATGGAAGQARPAVSLTVEVRPGAGAAPQRWTLTCGPVGGTLTDPAQACAVLARVKDRFAPVRRGIMCPMIYGGPQTATIEGTWHGEPVDATFSRVDGCQTERWTRIGPVFGPYASPRPRTG